MVPPMGKKSKRFVASLLAVVLLCGMLPAGTARAQEQYDPLHTMLALNMAIVSIHRIVTTQDRIVLDQEYQNIINNLKLGSIEADFDITSLYKELLSFVSGKTLRQEESERFLNRYDQREKNQLVRSLTGVRAYGGGILSFLGSLAVSCTSAYFGYQDAKNELQEGLDEELWRLKKEDIEECNNLQERLLDSSWHLLRQYGLPDEYRLVQKNMDTFYKAVQEPEPGKRLRMLQALEADFRVYPPYWFFRGRAALDAGDAEAGRRCFEQFDAVWRPVLKQDPYRLEVAKQRVRDRLENRAPTEEVLRELDIAREHTPREDWADNLFVGVAYFALGEKARAAECVQPNVDFGYETEISGPVLNAMRQGRPDWASVLPAELLSLTERKETSLDAAPAKAMNRDELVAATQDKEAAAALADYFEGHEEKAAEVLERLSKNSKNPAVFHALCLVEERLAQAPKDCAKVYRWEKQRDALLKEYGDAYRELLPLAEHCSENGSVAAQVFLGDLYRMGWGVEENLQKALSLFTKPAEQGDAYAQDCMGVIYHSLRDYNKAAEWYRKAAEQGLPWAQNNLGVSYYRGEGVVRSYEKAAEWYRKAADQGYHLAQDNLGDLYRDGKGVPQSDIAAAEWYRKAADQGNKYSQLQIGNLLENTWKDLKTAYKWYYLAYLNGHEDAQGKLNDIEGKGLIWDSAPKIPVADIESARAEAQKMYEEQKKRNSNP